MTLKDLFAVPVEGTAVAHSDHNHSIHTCSHLSPLMCDFFFLLSAAATGGMVGWVEDGVIRCTPTSPTILHRHRHRHRPARPPAIRSLTHAAPALPPYPIDSPPSASPPAAQARIPTKAKTRGRRRRRRRRKRRSTGRSLHDR